ncbi:discoidin domain-containing protein [Brevibacillus reuszeri]|uniref:discoidin domain-containing protein n=1 Tax=Brevibacillus reuszeri TaxID=54915 RepID=UPI003D25746A
MKYMMKYSKYILCFAILLTAFYSEIKPVSANQENLQDIVPEMLGYNTPAPFEITVSAVSKESYGWYAFDNKTTSGWYVEGRPQPEGGHFLKINLGAVKKIDAISLKSFYIHSNKTGASIKNWKLYGSNDDQNWELLSSDINPPDDAKNTYQIKTENAYSFYRINILDSYHSWAPLTTIGIGEMELLGEVTSPEPEPEPEPEPTGDHALLVIKMISGLEKEFDLTSTEVDTFIDWYNNRADGRGKETYMFEKDMKGPFTARKDYVAFSKIQSFEVMEYSK